MENPISRCLLNLVVLSYAAVVARAGVRGITSQKSETTQPVQRNVRLFVRTKAAQFRCSFLGSTVTGMKVLFVKLVQKSLFSKNHDLKKTIVFL